MTHDKKQTTDVVKLYFRDNDVSINPDGSKIIEYFTGKTVFITGGTGFLGKLLVEKLLRACEHIGKIYLLVRPKNGEDVKTRIEEYFNDKVFDHVKRLRPQFKSKVLGVQGDVGLLGLGLSEGDRKMLQGQVQVVFHCAATTRFNEKLKFATDINLRGTHEMLTLAKNFQNLEVFVHVSTAFSHCVKSHIDEAFYDAPIQPEQLLSLVENVPETVLDAVTPKLLGNWPNTYSYTKAVAEQLVRKNASQLPLCVTRPAIVTSTFREPKISWLCNVFGPTYIIAGSLNGQIRVAHANPQKSTDLVPGDVCINNIIAAAYKTGTTPKSPTVPIYNITSHPKNKLNWDKFINLTLQSGDQVVPSTKTWKTMLLMIPSKFWFDFLSFLIHSIPALIVDFFVPPNENRKRTFYELSQKIHYHSMSISYFPLHEWTFGVQNNTQLWEGLTLSDKKAFNFLMEDFDWPLYCQTFAAGLREYIFKESWDTLPRALKKRDRLLIIHRATVAVLMTILMFVVYKILSFLFNF